MSVAGTINAIAAVGRCSIWSRILAILAMVANAAAAQGC
jgi:hypothetical protein